MSLGEKRSIYHFPWNDLYHTNYLMIQPTTTYLGESVNPESFRRFISRQLHGYPFINRPILVVKPLPDGGTGFFLRRRFKQSTFGLDPTQISELIETAYGKNTSEL